MNGTLRQLRRSPFRAITSVLAIALAIAAIGVFAIPGVTEQTMRDVAREDRFGHIYLSTTPMTDRAVVDAIEARPDTEAVATRVAGTLTLEDGGQVYVTGSDPGSELDRLRVREGRAAEARDEVVASPGLAEIGDTLVAERSGRILTVVGIGTTAAFGVDDVLFTTAATASSMLGVPGPNHVTVTLTDPTEEHLRAAVADIRGIMADEDVALTRLPSTLPDGAHPIESEIEQVSFMIGSLGVIAGLVALVLLASTSNTIVSERMRDGAVLRAVGGSRRQVRRELRRPAIWIGTAGTVIGIPLGLVVANVIARMVLERFTGLTPSVGFSPTVIAASAVFGIAGARLVSGRVARRVVGTDLPTVLRDQRSDSFGDHRIERWVARLTPRASGPAMAIRELVHQRARSLSIAAQIAGAVAAAVLVASLATSVADFNDAELASYEWDSVTTPADPVYPFALDGDQPPGTEIALQADGLVDDWDIEVFGVDPATSMIDTTVRTGAWLAENGGPHDVVLAARFAGQSGIAVGDTVDIELATGTEPFTVVGLHPIRSVAAFVDAHSLADTLGVPGTGNTVWAVGDAAPPASTVATETVTRTDLFAEDTAGRNAIIDIFAAIGVIVVAIAAIGATSTVAMSITDRREALATLRAGGARSRDILRLLGGELLVLAAIGWALGVGGGLLGARAIMASFASSNAIDLGFAPAWWAIPASAVVTLLGIAALALSATRSTGRMSVAATLRASA